MERGKLDAETRTQRERRVKRRQKSSDAPTSQETTEMAGSQQKSEEGGKHLLAHISEEATLPTPWPQTSSPQNSPRIHFFVEGILFLSLGICVILFHTVLEN